MRFSGFSFRLGKRTRLYFHNDKKRAAAPAAPQQSSTPTAPGAYKSSRSIGGVILRILVLMYCVSLIGSTYVRGDLLPFVLSIVVTLAACCWLVWYLRSTARRDAMQQERLEEERQAREQAQLAAQEQAQREAQQRADAAAENEREMQQWRESHSTILTKVAGVTFKNADGSSRQAYLRDILASGACNTRLEPFEHDGAPALRVVVDGMEVGSIPRDVLPQVLAVLPDVDSILCTVDSFVPDDGGKRIYRADLAIAYLKQHSPVED